MGSYNELFAGIEELAEVMLDTDPDDRVLVYRKINTLFLNLEKDLKMSPNRYAEEKLLEVKHHIGIIARLDDPDGHSDLEHYAWALDAVGELRGPRGMKEPPK